MPDYMFLLDSRITADQREAVARVQQVAQAHEMNIYLAGGAVRDLVTGGLAWKKRLLAKEGFAGDE